MDYDDYLDFLNHLFLELFLDFDYADYNNSTVGANEVR